MIPNQTQGTQKATPVRSLLEIAGLIAFVIIIPPIIESIFIDLGLSTTGLTRIAVTGAIFVGIALLIVLMLALRGESVRDIGLKRPPNIAGAIVFGVLIAIAMFAALEVLTRVGVMSGNRLGDMASELRGDLALTLARMGLSIFVVGFVEELAYRGFIMDRVAKAFGSQRLGWGIAVFAQAALFGLSHSYQQVEGILFTGGVGLVLGMIFLLTGRNLWAPIIAHGVFNAARAAYIFYTLTYAPA